MILIIASVVNFAIMLFILWKYALPPMREFLAGRSQGVADSINEAEKLSGEADKLLSTWEANWKAAQRHAKEHFDEAKTGLEKFQKTTLTAAKKQADRIHKEGRLLGEGEVIKAKDAIRKDLSERSVSMSAEFLKGYLKEADQKKLVLQYLETVNNGSAR